MVGHKLIIQNDYLIAPILEIDKPSEFNSPQASKHILSCTIPRKRNPFPVGPDHFKYFEEERQNLWNPPAVGLEASQFSDFYKVEMEIMDTYEWYTYLVQLDIIGPSD